MCAEYVFAAVSRQSGYVGLKAGGWKELGRGLRGGWWVGAIGFLSLEPLDRNRGFSH
jgi:hypothetical protein